MEKVSIIITTYHRNFQMIKKALESTVNQTYKNKEIILVDDNGKDTIYQKEIEKHIKKYNVKYIINDENIGAQESRNKGALESTGKFLNFFDDDDYVDITKIEKQIKLFDKDTGLVFCKGYEISNNKTKKYFNYRMFKDEITINDLLYRDYIGSVSIPLIRKDIFIKAGMFDPNMKIRQDYDMWIRIAKISKIKGLNDYLFYYNLHDENQISKNRKNALEAYDIIYNKYKDLYDKKLKSKFYFVSSLKAFCKKSLYYGFKCMFISIKSSPITFINRLFKYPYERLFYR